MKDGDVQSLLKYLNDFKKTMSLKDQMCKGSISESFEIFYDLRFGKDFACDEKIKSGNENYCDECKNSHDGECILKSTQREAFMAGASFFLMALNHAKESGVPGAITQTLDRLSDEMVQYSMMKTRKLFKTIFDKIKE